MTETITPQRFHEADGVGDWRVVGDGACTFFPTASFAESARLVQAIAELPHVETHPPDVDVRRDGVTVRLITVTDDHYGMSMLDVELARRISSAARDLGLSADPMSVQRVLVIPGSPDAAGNEVDVATTMGRD
jgi:4a-hydroxytetrahydrobiopterin dehydratase